MMSLVSNVPDWNTNLLTRGVHREGQHRQARILFWTSQARMLPLLCHALQRLLEFAEPVFRSLRDVP
jgi:hypothetical protein